MPLNIMNGLMAGANFGQGYLQGQQLGKQLNYQNRLEQLSLEDANLRNQQQKMSLEQQQALSDKAMQLWSPTGQTQGAAVPPAQMPGQQTAGGGQQDAQGTPDRIEQLANFAASRGDLVQANQLWTNAANMRSAQATAQDHQAAAQLGELKRQQAHYQMAAQFAGTLPDTPEGFNQWKMMVLSDPSSSPIERQNVANMQYRPGLMQTIRDSGMNASQAAADKMRQLEFQERQRVNDMNIGLREKTLAERKHYDAARLRAEATRAKVGAMSKAPSAEEMKTAAPIIAQTLGIDQADPTLSSLDPNSNKFTQNTPAVIGVVAQAKQLMSGNRALTFPQAVAMATQQAKANGEFQTQTTTEHHFFGVDTTKSKTAYKGMGMTQDNPIDLSTIKEKGQLIKGRWYKLGDKVEQWQG